jgi:type III secretory pathway component EscU
VIFGCFFFFFGDFWVNKNIKTSKITKKTSKKTQKTPKIHKKNGQKITNASQTISFKNALKSTVALAVAVAVAVCVVVAVATGGPLRTARNSMSTALPLPLPHMPQ